MSSPTGRRLLLRDGELLDGTGGAATRVDVLVEDDIVRALLPPAARGTEVSDAEVLDCSGCLVTPGFVDAHAHDDLALLKPGFAEPKLVQGVTTDVIGNCGHGCAPLGQDPAGQAAYSAPVLGAFPDGFAESPPWRTVPEYLDRLASCPLPTNAVALVGHGALRSAVAGHRQGTLTGLELDTAAWMLDEALDHGAAGLSLGLMYAPGSAADHDELAALARTVVKREGVLAVHLRSEGDDIRASLEEVFRVARQSGVALHLSHLKVVSPANHGRMPELVETLDAARDEGIDLTADVYPYTAGSTTVSAMFPGWALADGVPRLLEQLADPDARARVVADLRRPWPGMENNVRALGGERIVLAGFDRPEHAGYEGTTLATIAADRGTDPVECLCDLVVAEQAGLTVVLHQLSEDDVATALAWPWSMIGSDGLPIEGAYTHPRMYGTFPRVLGEYTLRQGVLDTADAVRRMTTFPARRFGLRGRGCVATGQVADLTVLDPARLRDRATYASPRRAPTGVRAVLVCGRVCATDGTALQSTGTLLRRS